MKILYKYPTRQRPLKFLRCISSYYELMRGDNYEFVVTIDDDDEIMHSPEIISHMSKMKKLTVKSGSSKSKIEAINADIPNTDWDIVVLVSDDMFPEIEGFDNIIREDMQRLYPDTDGVLWYFDGWRRDLNTLCILGRKYYERFGYIYHPSYKSFWCDNEFMEVAKALGRQTFIDKIIIRHLHPEIVATDLASKKIFYSLFPEYAQSGLNGLDDLWKRNYALMSIDEKVYHQRKSQNFDM